MYKVTGKSDQSSTAKDGCVSIGIDQTTHSRKKENHGQVMDAYRKGVGALGTKVKEGCY